MKILKVVYGVVTSLCLFYGVPLTISNIGKESFVPYLIVALVGVVLLSLGATYLILSRIEKDNKEQ